MALKQVLTPSRSTAFFPRGVDQDNRVSSRTHIGCPRTRHPCVVRLQKAPEEAIQEAAQSDRNPSGVRRSGVYETLSEESKEVTERIGNLYWPLHKQKHWTNVRTPACCDNVTA